MLTVSTGRTAMTIATTSRDARMGCISSLESDTYFMIAFLSPNARVE
jgi:hypothetical protein